MIYLLALALLSPADAAEQAFSAHKLGPTAESRELARKAYALNRHEPDSTGVRGTLANILERYGEATTALSELLREYEVEAGLARTARLQLAGMEAASGFVTVALPTGAGLVIEDTRHAEFEIVNSYGPFASGTPQRVTLQLRSGQHTLQIGSLCTWHFDLAPGERFEHACAPKEAPESTQSNDQAKLLFAHTPVPDKSRTTWVYPTLAAAGGLSAIASVGFLVEGRRASSDADAERRTACEDTTTPAPSCATGFQTRLTGTAARLQTVSAIFAGVAGAALVTGAVVYLWSDPDEDVAAWVSPTGVGVSAAF